MVRDMTSSIPQEGTNKETLYHMPFILGAEVLSITLNQLNNYRFFHGFYM